MDARLFSDSSVIHKFCSGNPIADLLTSDTWNGEFLGEPNDGIVPVSSQLGGTSSTLVFSNNAGSGFGVIHSPGIELLNFLGPSEVDSVSGIPDEVINLLNEQINGPDFF